MERAVSRVLSGIPGRPFRVPTFPHSCRRKAIKLFSHEAFQRDPPKGSISPGGIRVPLAGDEWARHEERARQFLAAALLALKYQEETPISESR